MPRLFYVKPAYGQTESAPGAGISIHDVSAPIDLESISIPEELRNAVLQIGALSHATSPTGWAPPVNTANAGAGPWGPIGEAGPEMLAGPLPSYPDLLRQAGIEGHVVLEAVVDSSGRVQARSISVVSATHPGFVAPARQALIATLFRPARVNGRAVSTLVRVPFAFSIRSGIRRAW
jgi:protein TonB